MKTSKKNNVGLLVIIGLLICMLVISCSSDDDTVVDGDIDKELTTDGDISDNEIEITEQYETDLAEIVEEYYEDTFSSNVLLPIGGAAVITPAAHLNSGEAGDLTWKIADDFLSENSESNFGYSARGIELGYGDLSKKTKIAISAFELTADNGALLAIIEGPFDVRTQIAVEEDDYIYLYLEDDGEKSYVRLHYKLKTGNGLNGFCDISISPKFP